MSLRISIVLASIALSMLTSACGDSSAPKDAETQAKIERVRGAFGLRYPIHVEQWRTFPDAGSVGIELRDDHRHRLSFCYAVPPSTTLLIGDSVFTRPQRLLIGVDHPDPYVEATAFHGPEEIAVMDALDLAGLSFFPKARLDSLVDIAMDWKDHRAESEQVFEGLSDQEGNALRAAMAARHRRELGPHGSLALVLTPKDSLARRVFAEQSAR